MKLMVKRINDGRRIQSPIKQKVLLLIATNTALALTRSPGRQRWLLERLGREWNFINRRYLYRLIREFNQERLVDWREQPDDTIKLILSEKGRRRALQFNIDQLTIKTQRNWDGKWRVVFFDVPEKRRPTRDALRHKLRELGFHELQKSVMVYPYPCFDEINFVVEFFDARRYVRYGELTNLVNEAELKLHFKLV